MLLDHYRDGVLECGCDEAGRGCLAGPVFAAAVILPPGFDCPGLNDSKKLSEARRYELRPIIEQGALAWAVAECSPAEIDELNILRCSFLAMTRAIEKLKLKPELLLIDGNRFYNETGIAHECIVGGDGKFKSIAAASVLAKTYRDDRMLELARQYPAYRWDRNKGYPTRDHRQAIAEHGLTTVHRRTFNFKS